MNHFVDRPTLSVKRKFVVVQNGGNNLGAPQLDLPGETSRASSISFMALAAISLKNHQVRRSEFAVPGPVERHDFTVT